jgi:hypothetical protein
MAEASRLIDNLFTLRISFGEKCCVMISGVSTSLNGFYCYTDASPIYTSLNELHKQ